jgi:hypothetical protein
LTISLTDELKASAEQLPSPAACRLLVERRQRVFAVLVGSAVWPRQRR